MQSTVDFVQLDPEGIITREQWAATRLYCPKCGAGQPAVWVLMSAPPIKLGELETRVFLCIHCQHVSYGLNGFPPRWDPADRVEQIMKYAFEPEKAPGDIV